MHGPTDEEMRELGRMLVLVMRKQKRRGNKKEKKKQRQTYVMCGKRGRGEGSQSLLREPGRRTMIRKRKMLVHVCMLQCVQLNTALMYLFCLVCLFFLSLLLFPRSRFWRSRDIPAAKIGGCWFLFDLHHIVPSR